MQVRAFHPTPKWSVEFLGCCAPPQAQAPVPRLTSLRPHTTPFTCAGAIVSLSLGGACTMEFRRAGKRRALALPPRSLLIMAGAARLAWAHYIPHHKADRIGGSVQPRQRRVSLTFRQVGSSAVLARAVGPVDHGRGPICCGGACGCSTGIAGGRGEGEGDSHDQHGAMRLSGMGNHPCAVHLHRGATAALFSCCTHLACPHGRQ